MKIRYPTTKDSSMLANIGAETFWDAYHQDPHLEQHFIKTHIANTFTSEIIKEELRSENIIYLIAEKDSDIVGYARLLPMSSRDEIKAEKPLEISRIYLRKRFWGKQLGEVLLNRCLTEAEQNKSDLIWLSVWEYNERAIKFYEKFGFKIIGDHIFNLAGDNQTDYIMSKNL